MQSAFLKELLEKIAGSRFAEHEHAHQIDLIRSSKYEVMQLRSFLPFRLTICIDSNEMNRPIRGSPELFRDASSNDAESAAGRTSGR